MSFDRLSGISMQPPSLEHLTRTGQADGSRITLVSRQQESDCSDSQLGICRPTVNEALITGVHPHDCQPEFCPSLKRGHSKWSWHCWSWMDVQSDRSTSPHVLRKSLRRRTLVRAASTPPAINGSGWEICGTFHFLSLERSCGGEISKVVLLYVED